MKTPWMVALDAGEHERDCKRYPTGWLCTNTCPVEWVPEPLSRTGESNQP